MSLKTRKIAYKWNNNYIKIKNENLKKHVNQELHSWARQKQKSDTKRQKLGLLLL